MIKKIVRCSKIPQKLVWEAMFLGAFSKILWKKIGIKVLTFGGNIELTKLTASNLSILFSN